MLALVLNAHAQEQMKIAVLDFKAGAGVEQADIDGISAIFGTYFTPTGFTLVERTQIDRVIAEQGFQYSSLTEQQMVRVGEILNLQKMVIGDVNIVSGQYNVDVRVVDVETGAVDYKDGETWARSTSYRELMRKLAGRLMAKTNYRAIETTSGAAQSPASNTVVTLLGYLQVFPNDIGEFSSVPDNVIATLNQQAMYGYNDWRVPTAEELALMKANRSKLGLKSGDYMTSEGTRGNVRLVTTGKSVAEIAAALDKIDAPPHAASSKKWLIRSRDGTINQIWSEPIDLTVEGACATNDNMTGCWISAVYMNKNAKHLCPYPWRVPGKIDFENLLYALKGIKISTPELHDDYNTIQKLVSEWGEKFNRWGNSGAYWTTTRPEEDESCMHTFYIYNNSGFVTCKHKMKINEKSTAQVRCVRNL